MNYYRFCSYFSIMGITPIKVNYVGLPFNESYNNLPPRIATKYWSHFFWDRCTDGYFSVGTPFCSEIHSQIKHHKRPYVRGFFNLLAGRLSGAMARLCFDSDQRWIRAVVVAL